MAMLVSDHQRDILMHITLIITIQGDQPWLCVFYGWTLSTTKSEYVAASTAVRKLVWLRELLKGIGHGCVSSTILYVDK